MTKSPRDVITKQEFIAEVGAVLEEAARRAGVPVPPGTSRADLVQSLLEQMREVAQSPEARRVSEEMKAKVAPIYKELAAELPGGSANPAFAAMLLARLKVLAGPPSPEGSS